MSLLGPGPAPGSGTLPGATVEALDALAEPPVVAEPRPPSRATSPTAAATM